MSDRVSNLARPFTLRSFITFFFLLVLIILAARPMWRIFSWFDEHMPLPPLNKAEIVTTHDVNSLVASKTFAGKISR